tara:strand:+ start:1968 stop:2162 length:195 start_codon:yes stop_codon:yes gene_type:complete
MDIKKIARFFDKIIDWILKPGELICQLFKVKEGEPRYFLRLYLNIFIYTKIAVFGAVFLALHSI